MNSYLHYITDLMVLTLKVPIKTSFASVGWLYWGLMLL